MARFQRIVNVEDLVMTGFSDKSGGKTLGANFTAKTFIYLGDQEPAAPPPGKPKPKPAPGGKKEVGIDG